MAGALREKRTRFIAALLSAEERNAENIAFFLRFYNIHDTEKKSENKIQRFIRFKAKYEWPMLLRASEQSMQRALMSNVHWVMPQKDEERSTIFIFNAARIDPELASIESYQKMACYLIEIVMRTEDHQSMTFIADARSVPSIGSMPFSPSDLTRGVEVWYNACPLSIRRIYVLTSSWATKLSLQVALKPLLSRKMWRRLRFVDAEELVSSMGREKLPDTLNGATDMHREWERHLNRMIGRLQRPRR